MNRKRAHPFAMFHSTIRWIRNNLVVILYLFILRWNDSSILLFAARSVFLVILFGGFIRIFLRWLYTHYTLDKESIYIFEGVFKKSTRRVPLYRIRNIQRKVPIYFKLFKITSLELEMDTVDIESSVILEAISFEDAEKIEQTIYAFDQSLKEEYEEKGESLNKERERSREVIFQPTKKELFKASFLSLSFFIVISIAISMYEQILEIFPAISKLFEIGQQLTQHKIYFVLAILLILFLVFGLGIVWTFLRYGNYEIAADKKYIYIRQGILQERVVSLLIQHVQGIRILQNPVKKIFNLCEIELITTKSQDEDDRRISSFYPYLNRDKGYEIIEYLLPYFYPSENKMVSLPRIAMIMKFLRIPWGSLIILSILFFLLPTSWYLGFIFPVLAYISRYLDYRNTSFFIDQEKVHIEKGGLWSSSYVTLPQSIIEIEISQSIIQKKLGLVTIHLFNLEDPYHQESIEDLSTIDAYQFMNQCAQNLKVNKNMPIHTNH